MAEGTITAVFKSTNKELTEAFKTFVDSVTDGGQLRRKRGMTTVSGTCFIDNVELLIDEFLQSLATNQEETGLTRFILNDEYGTETFWILHENSIEKYKHDEEHDPISIIEAYDSFHNGMGSAYFGMFSKKDIQSFKRDVFGPRNKLFVRLVIEPFITYDPSRGEPLEGYNLAQSSSNQEGFRYAYWMPLSSDKYKELQPFFDHLITNGAEKITAVISPENISFPYEIVRASADGTKTVFDARNFSEDEIGWLDENREDIVRNINWFNAEPEICHSLIDTLDLEAYANSRLQDFRVGQQKEKEMIEQLRTKHPGKSNKLVKDQEIFLGYDNMDVSEVEKIANQMIIAGMHPGDISKGLGNWGENTIQVSDEFEKAAKWLIDNIEGLHDHKIKKHSWQSVIAINLC